MGGPSTAIAIVWFSVMALAGASTARAQSTASWILWEKMYTTKSTAPPTTVWEPIDGFDTLADCRKAAPPLLQGALAYMKSKNGKLLGPVQLEGRAAVFTITESGVEQTVDVRYLCFPGTFDPRPRP